MGQRHVRGRLKVSYLQLMYAGTSRFFPVDDFIGGLVWSVFQRTHLTHGRGTEEPGSRMDAASTVSGTSAIAEAIRETWTFVRLAILPHSSEPVTMAPKNTIWCTAMPRARMKLGRIICTAVMLLALTIIQQAPEKVMQMPKTTGCITSAPIAVDTAWMPIAQIFARSAPNRRLTVVSDRAPDTAPTPKAA